MKKIRSLVKECHFTKPDEHTIDALIFVFQYSKRTQTKLLDKDTTLMLDTTLDIALTEEVTSNQLKPGKKGKTKGGHQEHPKPPKGEPDRKKHFHILESCDQSDDSPQLSVHDQLYFHTLSVNQVTKTDT